MNQAQHPTAALLDRLMSPKEVATWLEVEVGTLATWRWHGRYTLPYIKIGRLIRYRRSDVEGFLNAQSALTTNRGADRG